MRTIAILALTTMVLSLSAPAQAQRFGIFFGDEPTDFPPEFAMCLTDSQIREWFTSQGYTDVSLNAPNEQNIQVRANSDGAVYLIDFNFCTRRIEGYKQLR